MLSRRHRVSGLTVFKAVKLSDGPPESWVAIGLDSRLTAVTTSLGRGPTAHDAEIDALAQLGASPNSIRAVIARPPEDGSG